MRIFVVASEEQWGLLGKSKMLAGVDIVQADKLDALELLSEQAETGRMFDRVLVHDDGKVDFLVKAMKIMEVGPYVAKDLAVGLLEVLAQGQQAAARTGFGPHAQSPFPADSQFH